MTAGTTKYMRLPYQRLLAYDETEALDREGTAYNCIILKNPIGARKVQDIIEEKSLLDKIRIWRPKRHTFQVIAPKAEHIHRYAFVEKKTARGEPYIVGQDIDPKWIASPEGSMIENKKPKITTPVFDSAHVYPYCDD